MMKNIDRKTFFLYLLAALPILCLGVTMLVFIFSLEYESYNSTFPTSTSLPTDTVIPDGTLIPNSTADAQPVTAPTSAPIVNSTPTVLASDIEARRERFLVIFKDIALVIAASIITFSSSYIGGLMQSQQQREGENRQERREQTRRYKEYLETILKMGQRKNLLEKIPGLRNYLPKQGREVELTEGAVLKMVNDMPLALGLRALEDEGLQEKFDEAVSEAIIYLIRIAKNKEPDYATMNEKYNTVVKALKKYANEG